MSAAWALEIGATDKIVLLALADHANDDGYCWPGNASIARKCGLSERAVRGAMGWLESNGHITRHFVTGKSTSFQIHPGTTCPRQDMPPAPRAKTPARHAPHPGTTCPTPRHVVPPNHKESSLTIKEPSKARRAAVVALPDWLPADAWAGFAEMRRKARKPLTERAMALAVKKLEALAAEGHDPGAVLDQSTMNNWQGLFPLKEQGNGHTLRANGSAPHRRNGSHGSPALDMLRDALGDRGFAATPEGDTWPPASDSGAWIALPAV